MKLDGRFEPLLLLAQVLTATGLGVAAGCALFWRHRAHTLSRREAPTVALTPLPDLVVETPRRNWRTP